MAASKTDKFLSVGKRGTHTTLQSPGKPIGASSIKLTKPINWPTDSLCQFSIRKVYVGGVDNGKEVPGSYTEWTGIVNASDGSIDSLELQEGADQDYPAGDQTQVFIHVSVTWSRKLIEGLKKTLNIDGTLKDKIVGLPKIDGGTTAGVLKADVNGTVTVSKATASDIDFATFAKPSVSSIDANESTSSAAWTDLATVGPSVTVNVPASGMLLVLFRFQSSAGPGNMAIQLSGANTQTPQQTDAAYAGSISVVANSFVMLTGLNPGATTIKAVYKSDSGTSSFLRRWLAVVPLRG